jgi:hypothetical protein
MAHAILTSRRAADALQYAWFAWMDQIRVGEQVWNVVVDFLAGWRSLPAP